MNQECFGVTDKRENIKNMLKGFEKLVEERIRKAQQRGDFDSLPGSGKPIEFEDNTFVPEDLRLAYKILKNADCIPKELELNREIRQTEDLLADMKDSQKKYRLQKKLDVLIMKLNSERPSSSIFKIPGKYNSKLVNHMTIKPSTKKK